MSSRATIFIATLLLAQLAIVSVWTASRDSLTFDEKAHIAAGYSYLVKQDYRLNPEHPPLLKDLAALPLLALNLSFPDEDPSWTQNEEAPPWWVQFDVGNALLFEQGNNPRSVTFLARIPMIILLTGLALLVFLIARALAGNNAGLIALALASLSPTLIAHGRLVTTDTGAAFAFLSVFWAWALMVKHPSPKRMAFAGIMLGLALLTKFSLLLALPVLALSPLIPLLGMAPSLEKRKKALSLILLGAEAGLIALFFVVWPVYRFHIENYPQERQIRDTAADLNPGALGPARDIVLQMAETSFLRSPAQFLRGVLMAAQRSAWGNTAFFMGTISAEGNPLYFPALFLLKTPLALTLLIVMLALVLLARPPTLSRIRAWVPENPFLALSGVFVLLYVALSITSNLNIGIRHLLPIFPFLYIIIGIAFSQSRLLAHRFSRVALALLLIWYAVSAFRAFPYHLSFYNELTASDRGYEIAVDSNYDWGQDFTRLLDIIQKREIEHITLDYFGGEDPSFWLQGAYQRFDPRRDPRPKGWFAVSLNHLQGGRARGVRGFDQDTSYYRWLDSYEPVERAGTSILLYFIP